ncbi:hypothetical protein ACFQZ4_18350 [Catellatospora coxensis]
MPHHGRLGGFAAAPTSSECEADGRRYAHREDGEVALVIGPDAASIVREHSCSTVHYADCAAMMSWPDGARRLIGNDGIVLHLEPAMWAMPYQEIGALDAGVGPARHLPQPARDPASIPRPAAAPPAAAPPADGAGNVGEIIAIVLLGLVAAGLGLLTLLGVVVGIASGGAEALDWAFLGCMAVFTAMFATPVVMLLRRRRRRR